MIEQKAVSDRSLKPFRSFFPALIEATVTENRKLNYESEILLENDNGIIFQHTEENKNHSKILDEDQHFQ